LEEGAHTLRHALSLLTTTLWMMRDASSDP
jgi:hypothetical protein